jgi:integrase/recombinase XerD
VPEQLPLFTHPEARPEAQRPGPGRRGVGIRPSTPLHAAILAWEEFLRNEGALDNTVKSFAGDLRLLSRFLGDERAINTIATRDLQTWLDDQRSSGRSPKTYMRRVTSLKSFFRWLELSHVLPHDPAETIVQQSVLSPLPVFLEEAEVDQALGAARMLWQRADKPDLRPYVLLALLIQTGIKKSECLALELNHIDLDDPAGPALWVRYKEARHRLKERKLPLSSEWADLYRNYLAFEAPQQRVFPYSPRRLEYLLEDVTIAGGLTKHISFEMCRWTFAVRQARNGTDFDLVRRYMGLSRIQWREIGMKLKRLLGDEAADDPAAVGEPVEADEVETHTAD